MEFAFGAERHKWLVPIKAIALSRNAEDPADAGSWFFAGFLRALLPDTCQDGPTTRANNRAVKVDDVVVASLDQAERLGFDKARAWSRLLQVGDDEWPICGDHGQQGEGGERGSLADDDQTAIGRELSQLQLQLVDWLRIAGLTGGHTDTRIVACLVLVGLHWQGTGVPKDRGEGAVWWYIARELGLQYTQESLKVLIESVLNNGSCSGMQVPAAFELEPFERWVTQLEQDGALSAFAREQGSLPDSALLMLDDNNEVLQHRFQETHGQRNVQLQRRDSKMAGPIPRSRLLSFAQTAAREGGRGSQPALQTSAPYLHRGVQGPGNFAMGPLPKFPMMPRQTERRKERNRQLFGWLKHLERHYRHILQHGRMSSMNANSKRRFAALGHPDHCQQGQPGSASHRTAGPSSAAWQPYQLHRHQELYHDNSQGQSRELRSIESSVRHRDARSRAEAEGWKHGRALHQAGTRREDESRLWLEQWQAQRSIYHREDDPKLHTRLMEERGPSQHHFQRAPAMAEPAEAIDLQYLGLGNPETLSKSIREICNDYKPLEPGLVMDRRSWGEECVQPEDKNPPSGEPSPCGNFASSSAAYSDDSSPFWHRKRLRSGRIPAATWALPAPPADNSDLRLRGTERDPSGSGSEDDEDGGSPVSSEPLSSQMDGGGPDAASMMDTQCSRQPQRENDRPT